MKKTPYYLIPVLVCFLLGFIAGRIQSDAIENWYPLLDKPALTPPNIAFPIAWSVIYLCSGGSRTPCRSSGRAGRKPADAPRCTANSRSRGVLGRPMPP